MNKIIKNTFESNLHFRIMKYGVEVRESFTFDELSNHLNLTKTEQDYIKVFLICYSGRDYNSYVLALEIATNEMERAPNSPLRDKKMRLTTSAVFEYIDYLEIVAARESATQAKYLSWIAIGISIVLGLAQIFVSVK